VNARDPKDLELLLAQSNWLQRLARGLVHDPAAADDLVQDTWVAALRHAPTAGAADLRAWMRVVARNFAHGSRRESGRRAEREPDAAREERIDGPDELAARFELQRRLGEAVLALEQPYRDAIVKRYIDGLSTIQVAEQLGISHDAARQRISRGLAKLRERLDRDHEGGRSEWMSALLPFARTPTATTAGGLLLMGTKTKIAAALVLGALGLWMWKGPLAPSALEPNLRAAAVASDAPGEAAPRAPLEGMQSDARAEVAIPTMPSPAADLASVEMLRGIVLDPKDHAVEGARIAASSSISYDYQTLDLSVAMRTERAGETASGADGRFELRLDPARSYQLAIEKLGYAQATLGRRRPGEMVTVRLSYGAAIEGHITQGESKLPVASASVRCFLRSNDSPDGARFEQVGVTDARGAYRLDMLPPGVLFFEATSAGLPGSEWIEVHPEAGKTITQDVNLAAKAWFRGRVLDARTRAPIASAELATIWFLRNPVATDVGGNFTLPLDGVSDGGIYVRAAGYGFRGFPQPERTGASGTEGLEILLEPARKARGRLLDPQGGPVADAYVAACGSENGAVDRHDWVASTSDAEGRFELTDLRPDMQHSLFVRAQGFGSVVYEFPASESSDALVALPDLVLRPAGSIRGTVVDENDHPLPDLAVILRGANADRGLWNTRGEAFLDNYVGERKGRTDDRGAFTFDELAAGNYQVELHRDSHEVTSSVEVALASGERHTGVKLSLADSVTMQGRVHDRAGMPVRSVMVSIEPTAKGLSACDVQTGADGRFVARGIVPGTYRIQLWSYDADASHPERAFHVHTTHANLQADGRELDLVIEDGAWITGVVVEADGKPATSVRVEAKGAGAEFEGSGETDAQGKFRIGVEHDKSFPLEAKRMLAGDRAGMGAQTDPDESHWGRVPQAIGGAGEVRIVMPPH